MPLYDLQCIKCGQVEEKLFTTWMNFITNEEFIALEKAKRKADRSKKYASFDIIDVQLVHQTNHQRCDCGGFQELVPPLTNMQPDSMWSGQNTKFGYFTSKSQFEQTLKEKNLVTVTKKELDTVRKKVYNTKQANKQQQLNNLSTFIEKELASVEISPDGNTVKERNKYARKRKQ